MKSIKILGIVLSILIIASCASIPASTSKLTENVIDEANGMHKLNVSLVSQLFDERQQRINDFMAYQYTPALLKNIQKKLPDSVNYEEELPNILQSIVPVINEKRDSLQSILDTQEKNILDQLNTTYTAYSSSTGALQNLIDSAVKLKSAEKQALSAIEGITGISPGTVSNVEAKVNDLLLSSGANARQLLQIINSLK